MSGLARGAIPMPGYQRQSSQHSYYYPTAATAAVAAAGGSYYGQPVGRQHRSTMGASMVRRQESMPGKGGNSGGGGIARSRQQQQHYQSRKGKLCLLAFTTRLRPPIHLRGGTKMIKRCVIRRIKLGGRDIHLGCAEMKAQRWSTGVTFLSKLLR